VFLLVSRAGTNIFPQVLKHLETINHLRDSLSSHLSLSILTYRGFTSILSLSTSFPLGSPGLPLVLDSSFTKVREGLSEVTVGNLSHRYRHPVDWVGIFPTYSLCDNKVQKNLSYSFHNNAQINISLGNIL
jgi:hypothetical protein